MGIIKSPSIPFWRLTNTRWPNPEELFVELSEGEKFSKPDLSRAYQQILLDEDSREYVTINIHKSLYRPTPLPFGVSSASAIFQSKIEQVL